MNFYTIQELQAAPDDLLQELARDGELVITRDGKPAALMLNLADGNFDERIKAVIQDKAQAAFASIRARAAARSFLSDEEIEAEIAQVRAKN